MSVNFDYVIVGAGAAGCILASRLSEDENITVLLVEAGGSDKNPIITMPGALPFVYQNKNIQWNYQSGPEPYLDNKMIDEKAGKVLGGSTSINAMIYNRGNPMDFEGWAATGLTDWKFADVLPYFRKMETFEDGADDWRGDQGPMQITRCKAEHKLFDVFLRSGEQAGFEVTPDHNGYKQEGLHIAQSFIYKGVRWSSPKAYLYPVLHRKNLHLMKNALVNRVVVENGTATGIEISVKGGSEKVIANREVIVCAGALNSPKLLMLSGIGDPTELAQHGITVTAVASEVGKNLQNHPGVDVQFSTKFEHSLTSKVNWYQKPLIGAEWLFKRSGLGASNFFEAGAFLRTRSDVDFPNMQYEFLPLTRVIKRGKLVPIPGYQFWMDLSRPLSRGQIKLKSANPADHPSIIFNTYQEKQDLKDLIDGVRLAREIARQSAWDKFRGEELSPGTGVQSDEDLAAFIKYKTGTSYHPSGACRMGVDQDAVVDGEGRVRAVKNMRVVDASIMPLVVTGNLNAAVMMMAEKIADAIKGIKLPASQAEFYYKK